MKKCIVTGIVSNSNFSGINCFTVLNGDIETHANNEEVYITSRKKQDSNESEDVYIPVSTMSKNIQEYIKTHKRYIDIISNS